MLGNGPIAPPPCDCGPARRAHARRARAAAAAAIALGHAALINKVAINWALDDDMVFIPNEKDAIVLYSRPRRMPPPNDAISQRLSGLG
jgi:hypothetical protein